MTANSRNSRVALIVLGLMVMTMAFVGWTVFNSKFEFGPGCAAEYNC